jgi:O-antigen ligase
MSTAAAARRHDEAAALPRHAIWLPVVCLWLLPLTTFSAVGRTGPQALEAFDSITLAKLAARAITLLASGWVLAICWRTTHGERVRWQLFPFALFIVWAVITVAWSPMRGFSLSQASSLVALVMLAGAVGCVWRGTRDTSLLLMHLSLALLVYSSVVIVAAAIDFEASGLNVRTGNAGMVHPTPAGATASLALLLLVACRLLWNWKWTRVLLAPAVIIHGLLLIVSGSRAAVLLTASLGLGALLVLNSRLALGLLLLSISAAGTIYLAIDPGLELLDQASEFTGEYLRRGQSAQDLASVSGRSELWAAVWAAFLDSPLVGQGYFMCSPTGILDVWEGPSMETAHNLLLQVLVSTGIVGTALFLWGIARPGMIVMRKLRGGPNARRLATLIVLFGCWYAGWGLVCESFMGPIQPESVVFFVLLGIALGSASRLEPQGSASSSGYDPVWHFDPAPSS